MPTQAQIKGKLKFYSKPYGRQWKWRYQRSGAFFDKPLQIPESLVDKGIEIIDPLKPKIQEKTQWTPPRRHPVFDSFLPQPVPSMHPYYKNKEVMLFDKTIKFHAGVDQVCLLTKTQPVYNFSDKIIEISKKFTVKDEDTILQNIIKQALAFHATKEFCKNFKIPKDIKYNIGREYATPENKQMEIIIENSIRLCNSMIKDHNTLLSRKLIQNASFHTTFERADDVIHLRRNSDFVLYSKTPLKAIGDENEIKKSVDYKFIDMYPIFPTVDLLTEAIYEDRNCIGWYSNIEEDLKRKLNNPFKFIHTIFHINDDKHSLDQDVSRLIMYAFGYAHAQVKLNQEEFEMNTEMELKKPFVVNGVSIQNEKLNFISFQLNTMNFRNNNGIRNIVYIEKNNELYLNRPNLDSLPYPSRRNIQRYAIRKLEYNSSTFQKFKSILLNGV